MAFRPWTVNNLDMALAKITVKKLKQALTICFFYHLKNRKAVTHLYLYKKQKYKHKRSIEIIGPELVGLSDISLYRPSNIPDMFSSLVRYMNRVPGQCCGLAFCLNL